MGTVSKPLLLFLSLLSLHTFSGCATLPKIEDYGPLSEDGTPKIIGPKGQLSPKISKTIMERLKGQVEPTDILQRHTLLIEVISGSSLVTANKVTLLIDGPATYEAMFEAIQSAKDHINFETFIFDDDELGRRFADLLLQKQAEGVQVNLIYDSVGCMTTPPAFFQHWGGRKDHPSWSQRFCIAFLCGKILLYTSFKIGSEVVRTPQRCHVARQNGCH